MTATIVAGSAAVLGLLAFGWYALHLRAKAERGRAAEKGLDHAREAREIDEAVARLDEPALDDELRKRS